MTLRPPSTPTDTQIEKWFRQRGLPLFVDGHDARTHVWTRAMPFLLCSYMLLALPYGVSSWGQAATALATSAACVVVGWVAGNLADRQRPFSRPTSIGAIELTALMVGVALPHLLHAEYSAAAEAVVEMGINLAVIYWVVAYGLISLLTWVVRRLTRSLPDVRNAAVRALPMLLIFIALLLFTGEIWQAVSSLRGTPFVVTQLLFALVALLFVSGRLRADSLDVETFGSWSEVAEHAAGTPAAAWSRVYDLAGDGPAPEPPVPHPLTARQRRNVLLVLMSNQVIMALTVAVAMGVFYLVLGFLTIDAAVVKAWTGSSPTVWLEITLSGRRLIVSEQHVRVAAFLASFSGFYFAVYSVTDPTIREGLTDDGTTGLRAACAARQLYLDHRRAGNLTG